MGRSWPATRRRRRTRRCRRPGKLLAEAAAVDAAEDAQQGSAAGPVTPRALAQRAGRRARLAAAAGRLAAEDTARRDAQRAKQQAWDAAAAEGRPRPPQRPLDEPRTNRNNTPPRANITDPLPWLLPLASCPGMQLAGRVRASARAWPAATALAVMVLGVAGCGGVTSSRSAVPLHHGRPCAQLAAVSPGLLPVLADLAGGKISLVTNQPVRRQLLRFTSDAARWAAASGATAFTTLFRHLRHLWNWPSGLIPELAGEIRSDIAAAETHCATGGT